MTAAITGTLTSIVSIGIVLGVLIFVHEFGHFVVAKLVGVRVERFSLGFGPRIAGFVRGETEYRLSWIPLGGYVKMTGENPAEDVEPTVARPGKDPRSFDARPVWARSAIVVAGPLANVVLAAAVYTVAAWTQGEPRLIESTRIGYITEGGPAQRAGLVVGDSIVSVDGVEMASWGELVATIHPRPERGIELVWMHDGVRDTAAITTVRGEVVGADGLPATVGLIGVSPGVEFIPVGPFHGVEIGLQRTWTVSAMVVRVLVGLVRGKVSPSTLGGPILIAQAAAETARAGPSALFGLIALLSINLALLNILPIPVLDGGRLLLLTIEGMIRRPPSAILQMRLQQAGFALIVFLILFVTYQDLARIFR
jgi:regulator of sigma E protease